MLHSIEWSFPKFSSQLFLHNRRSLSIIDCCQGKWIFCLWFMSIFEHSTSSPVIYQPHCIRLLSNVSWSEAYRKKVGPLRFTSRSRLPCLGLFSPIMTSVLYIIPHLDVCLSETRVFFVFWYLILILSLFIYRGQFLRFLKRSDVYFLFSYAYVYLLHFIFPHLWQFCSASLPNKRRKCLHL